MWKQPYCFSLSRSALPSEARCCSFCWWVRHVWEGTSMKSLRSRGIEKNHLWDAGEFLDASSLKSKKKHEDVTSNSLFCSPIQWIYQRKRKQICRSLARLAKTDHPTGPGAAQLGPSFPPQPQVVVAPGRGPEGEAAVALPATPVPGLHGVGEKDVHLEVAMTLNGRIWKVCPENSTKDMQADAKQMDFGKCSLGSSGKGKSL